MGLETIVGLYPHQEEGAQFLTQRGGGCLFMEPGTGKTRAALEYCFRRMKGRPGRVLVVAPPICLSVWEEELAECFPEPYQVFRLDTESAPMFDRGAWAFFLVSYGWLVRHKNWLWFHEHTFDVMICDESHFIKSLKAQRTEAVFSLIARTHSRVCLTGTPVAKELLDVYSQFKFAAPDVFKEEPREFFDKWAIMGGYYRKQVKGVRNKPALLEEIKKGAYVVKKEDCLDLPPLTIQRVNVEMSKQAMALHDELYTGLRQAVQTASAIQGMNPFAIMQRVGTKLIQLQRIAGGFFSHIDGDGTLEQIDTVKVKATADLTTALNRRVVVFVRFRAEIDAVMQEFRARNIQAWSITGDTADKVRVANRRSWAFAEEPCALVMQESLGMGITLTQARYCLFYSWDYNYINWRQALDRLHRITQRNPVTAYMITARNSIDDKVLKVLEKKGNVSDLLMSI